MRFLILLSLVFISACEFKVRQGYHVCEKGELYFCSTATEKDQACTKEYRDVSKFISQKCVKRRNENE